MSNMLFQNIKYALNNLKKNKVYSALNTIGLSIGFSVVTIIVLFLMSEHFKDKNVPNYQNIYRLYDTKQNQCAIDYKLSDKLLDQYPEIQKSCAIRTFIGFDIPLASSNNFVNENKAFLTTNTFFDIFDIQVVKSISEKPLPDFQSATITQSLANRLFPNEEALGKKINFFGYVDFTVSAIIDDFEDKSLNCNFIIHGDNPKFNNWGQNNNVTISSHYLVLKPNTDINSLTTKLNTYLSKQKPKIENAGLQRLDDIYLNSSNLEYNAHDQGNKKMLLIFLAISILILLLSNINNFNYSLSLQYNSLKDIGVRKTNGASATQILRLFIADSSLKVFISVLISIGLTFLALPFVSQVLNNQLNISVLLTPSFLMLSSLFLIFIILFNSVSSFYIFSRFDIKAFLSGGKSKNNKQTGKSVLTVFQLSVSVLLLISMLVIHKQISFVKHADIGFNKEQLIRVNLPVRVSEGNAKAFKRKIEHLSCVQISSLSNGVPGMINYTSTSDVEGNDFNFSELLVDADFLQTMGINLKAGRNFRNSKNNKVCIINETALKKYGWEDFSGKKYNNRGGLEVIGISSDFNISSLHNIPVPVCLVYADNRSDYAQINIKLNGGNTSQMLKDIEKEWETMFSALPFDFTFYDQHFDSMYKKEEQLSKILSLLSFLALLITSLGILSTSFQNCLNKTKEIGIRKVNGAKVSEILSMLNKDFVKWVAIAFVIACPIAFYAMNKWLENFAYKTTLSWWIFALAGALALGIALLTVSWQSWRAATRNPVEALMYE